MPLMSSELYFLYFLICSLVGQLLNLPLISLSTESKMFFMFNFSPKSLILVHGTGSFPFFWSFHCLNTVFSKYFRSNKDHVYNTKKIKFFIF